MRETVYSFRDSKGCLWVNCAECERGGNGLSIDKCAAGGDCKNGKDGRGCFSGLIMEHPKKLLSEKIMNKNKGK